MDETAATQWIEPYSGFGFRDATIVIEAAAQTHELELCEIDPAVFAGAVDPAAFISLAIQAGVNNGISANGTVNMVQHLVQHRPVLLGEELVVSGRITAVDEVPRGRIATSETWFCGKDGQRAITTGRRSLRPNPAQAGTRGAGDQPAPVVADVAKMRCASAVTLVAEKVRIYGGRHNPIHYDPEAARRGGFRAPIIGGGMGVRYLTAEIWRQFSPRVLDLDIYFRRPIFWDDSFSVLVGDDDGVWKSICLAKGDKIATEARINRIGS